MAETSNHNFQMLCRFCLSREGEMLSINGKDPSHLANSIREKILFTTSIKMPPNNEEAAVICSNCDILLNGFFIFKKRSYANNLKVQAMIQQRFAAENGNWRSSKKSIPSFQNKTKSKLNKTSILLDASIMKSELVSDDDSVIEFDPNISLMQDANVSTNANFLIGAKNPILIKAENAKKILEAVKKATRGLASNGISGDNQTNPGQDNGNGTLVGGHMEGSRGECTATPGSLDMSYQEDSTEESELFEEGDLLKYLKLEETPNNYYERKQCVSPNGWGVMLIRRCAECGAKFTALSDLRKHKAEMGHSDPKCTICTRTFLSPIARDNHMRKKHKSSVALISTEGTSSGKKQRRCTECGEWFPSLGDLRIHKKMLGHSDPTCNICQRKFISKDACERHLRKKHKIYKQGSVQNCSICGMCFGKKKDLLAHINLHIGIKNVSVSNIIEGKSQATSESTSTSKKTLAKHLCSICGKGFTKLKSVQQHKNSVHSLPKKDQAYTCPICSKVFHYKKRLEDHVNLHIGFQPSTTPVKNTVCTVLEMEPPEEKVTEASPSSATKKSQRKKRSYRNRYEDDEDFVELSSSPDQ